MEKTLQNILFPTEERLQAHWKLFYRGYRCVISDDYHEITLAKGITIDFATYLNGFSAQKWRLYTNLHDVKLHLTIKGKFRINLVGYQLNSGAPVRNEFSFEKHDFSNPETIVLHYPDDSTAQMYSFEILPESDCVLYSGSYSADFAQEDIRKVTLSLATTTCRKEAFITKNIDLIKREILSAQDEISEHFYLHVIDNGRTLHPEELDGYHVTIHPNKNTGGSGGFARGMIESLHQTPEVTHVLLMDDDVLILPESLRRTYTLLTVLKPEFQESCISGAMLEYEEMNLQHEDIGNVLPSGEYRPAKGRIDQSQLTNVLRTNEELSHLSHPYAAWWFCCIPATVIRQNGLPLPFFIRADDIEYGLRCSPYFISMTGICVWHMHFANKYNASMDLYQTSRNFLIAHTVRQIQDIDYMLYIRRLYRIRMLEFAYDAAEIILRALEDYMRGPKFIEQDLGEKIMIENRAFNEVLLPLSTFNVDVHLEDVYANPPRKTLEKWIFRATYNGQRFWPKSWLKKDTAVIAFDWPYQPQVESLHEKLLAVNIFDRTANLRVQDRKRYRELQKRYRKDMSEYKSKHKEIEQEYLEAREYLCSEEFWKKYLEIE